VREWLVEHGRAGASVERMESSLRQWLTRVCEEEAQAAGGAVRARVRHKSFGEGTVLRELPGDKLEVQFEAVGVKVMLRRFVEVV
jgi:hypothetical protein